MARSIARFLAPGARAPPDGQAPGAAAGGGIITSNFARILLSANAARLPNSRHRYGLNSHGQGGVVPMAQPRRRPVRDERLVGRWHVEDKLAILQVLPDLVRRQPGGAVPAWPANEVARRRALQRRALLEVTVAEVFAGVAGLCGHPRCWPARGPAQPGDRPPTKRAARLAEAISAPARRITRTIANYD